MWPFKKPIPPTPPPPTPPRIVEVTLERSVGNLRIVLRAEVGDTRTGTYDAVRLLRGAMEIVVPGR